MTENIEKYLEAKWKKGVSLEMVVRLSSIVGKKRKYAKLTQFLSSHAQDKMLTPASRRYLAVR